MEHLFHSLRQQLAYEIFFAGNVSAPYRDFKNKLDIVDFEYRGQSFQLVLNGKISLKSSQMDLTIESYQDLVHGLIQSNGRKKRRVN